MKKNLLLLLSLITLPAPMFAMENNQQTPGQTAIKNHPYAWRTTQLAGGTVGAFVGVSIPVMCMAFGDLMLSVANRGSYSPARKRLEILKIIAISSPFVYGGWKGGQALSEAIWHPTWNGVDKVNKFRNFLNK